MKQTVTYGVIRRLLNENFDEVRRMKRAVGKPHETDHWPLDDSLAVVAQGLAMARSVLMDARKVSESIAKQQRDGVKVG